ncbi:MAG: hypothetical protein Tsb0017_07460 [Geothermobacteraceae bacterium]
MKRISLCILLALISLFAADNRCLAAEDDHVEQQLGIGLLLGSSYDPTTNIDFYQLNLSALFDYEQIWPQHSSPPGLRFKIEGNLGLSDWPATRALLSANMFALYYLLPRDPNGLRPYIEGGIGLIYSDFQVAGQGLRLNFNPQLGIGLDRLTGEKGWFADLRLHHISNGNLHHDNRGINSLALVTGIYF